MEQPGLNNRHRNKDGEISRKHGNTLVSTLRRVYGESFAEGFSPETPLSAVLAATHERSLSQFHRDQLHNDHDGDRLASKIAEHRGEENTLHDEVAASQAQIDKGAP